MQSVLADGERLQNWYVERSQSSVTPSQAALYPTPGFRSYVGSAQGITDVGARAAFAEIINGVERCFFVIGGQLYEVLATQTVIKRGSPMAQDNYPATISFNGIGGQLGITSGGNWYNYDLASNTLSQIAAMNGKATMGGQKDSFFLAFDINNTTVYVSNSNDGTTWNTSTMFISRSTAADPWRAMVPAGTVIYMIGEKTSEALYNAGNSPQPFAPILSSAMQSGTCAPFSARLVGNAVMWLEQRVEGVGQIVSALGYDPQVVSNYAVETAVASYASMGSLADVENVSYIDQGHLFANITFPAGSNTWSVDNDTREWHERSYLNPLTGQQEIWRPRVHCYAFGKHLTGDRNSGTISEMNVSFGTETDGSAIRRQRIGPPLWVSSTRQRLEVNRFEVMVDSGLGAASGQGVNPQMMFSKTTNGQSWSTQRLARTGKQGQHNVRVYWNNCGSADRMWAPQITATDPVPWRIVGAMVEGSGWQQLRAA